MHEVYGGFFKTAGIHGEFGFVVITNKAKQSKGRGLNVQGHSKMADEDKLLYAVGGP